jgi:hypothetical protein
MSNIGMALEILNCKRGFLGFEIVIAWYVHCALGEGYDSTQYHQDLMTQSSNRCCAKGIAKRFIHPAVYDVTVETGIAG